jgi:ABC-type multidrug transport system ATPase subunit
MAAIYTLMGVCPQHDLLWETLTGREHLLFYGRLKGLRGEGGGVIWSAFGREGDERERRNTLQPTSQPTNQPPPTNRNHPTPGKELTDMVESGLRAVNLWNSGVADKQARAYSGGMKRRLSVAISFVGNPLVVYLDEPSTVG